MVNHNSSTRSAFSFVLAKPSTYMYFLRKYAGIVIWGVLDLLLDEHIPTTSSRNRLITRYRRHILWKPWCAHKSLNVKNLRFDNDSSSTPGQVRWFVRNPTSRPNKLLEVCLCTSKASIHHLMGVAVGLVVKHIWAVSTLACKWRTVYAIGFLVESKTLHEPSAVGIKHGVCI